MRSSEFITEKNQLNHLKLNTDKQVTNVNNPSDAPFLHKLIYVYQFKNANEATRFEHEIAQKNLNPIQCQAESIVLLDHVLSTNSIQHTSHGFMYRRENFHLNLFIFVIVLLSTLVLVLQAFKVDRTD
jgi:hypothetical protein